MPCVEVFHEREEAIADWDVPVRLATMPRAGLILLAASLSCRPPVPGVASPQGEAVAIRVNQIGYQAGAPKVAVSCDLAARAAP